MPAQRAKELLRTMLRDPRAEFRPGQLECILDCAVKQARQLVVQKTGWGKSFVYFIATRMLREVGAGPTLLISPLLSLMRNQIAMAERIGIRAYNIDSTNREKWDIVHGHLAGDACDVLLISPERLANAEFRAAVLPSLTAGIGLFVVDEAHCISDWGHDFRPDYRQIRRFATMLASTTPILATTATANDRVVEDISVQLGLELKVVRGPLLRTPLGLSDEAVIAPLTPTEWHRAIGESRTAPGELLSLPAEEIRDRLDCERQFAERMVLLLGGLDRLLARMDRFAGAGIWMITRFDESFPNRLVEHLGMRCPPVVFGASRERLLGSGGIAIVGARNMSEEARRFAECAGAATAAAGMAVISGGARGIDQAAMRAAVSAGGNALGVLADSLERAIRERETQELLEYGSLCIVTPYSPSLPFSVANAMGRNKIIYALADYALVVDSDFEKGGTWSGAVENLRQGFVPLFVRESPDSGPGNQQLIRRRAVPLTFAEINSGGALTELMEGKLNARTVLYDTAQPDERLSRLVEYLQQPRRTSEISEELGLSKAELRELIKSALATNQIVRLKERPVTYQAGAKVSTSDLFGSGDP